MKSTTLAILFIGGAMNTALIFIGLYLEKIAGTLAAILEVMKGAQLP